MATSQQPNKPVVPAAKPAAQPVKQVSPKPITNDTTTSTNPANAEIQPKPATSVDTGEKSNTVLADNISEVKEAKPSLSDLFSKDSSELQAAKSIASTDPSLQNEKNLQDEEKVRSKSAQESTQFFQPQIQAPTPGRVVHFFFAKDDGICSNNMVESLPGTVVLSEGLVTNLVVFTLDTRDPVVLRKSVPHISEASKDSEDNVIKPYWDWPVINR
jgi:hypothetical protein